MKFAIFGDIHGDLDALQMVLDDARTQGCTQYACLGDIVGLGAHPEECVELVRTLGCPVVRGDHDQGAAGTSMLEDLNPLARESLLWTREQLSPEQRQWLAALPLVRSVADFTIVHATLDEPGTWGYLINADDARASIVSQTTPLCFFGHTHRALIYEKDEGVRVLLKRQVSLQKRAGYLINPGSVGRACGTESPTYAIYDQDRRHVQIRSLGGDLECLPLVS